MTLIRSYQVWLCFSSSTFREDILVALVTLNKTRRKLCFSFDNSTCAWAC